MAVALAVADAPVGVDDASSGGGPGSPPAHAPGRGGAARVQRPVLRAWVAEHDRERKRMALFTQQAYAQWLGVDPAQWSKWRSGALPVPRKQGRRLVVLLDHNPRIASLWLRLVIEQEQLAITGGPSARPGPAP